MKKNKAAMKRATTQLSLDLIEAQYALKNTRGQANARSVLILVGGIEFAGKSEAIKQLREWMDPRYLYVKADIPNEIHSKMLFWHPYVADLPSHGEMKLFFGNWYTDLLASVLYGQEAISEASFQRYQHEMQRFERYLQDNGTDIVKIWFDLSLETTQKRIRHLDLAKALQRVPDFSWDNFPLSNWRNKKLYDDIQDIRQRFTSDWIIIDGENEKLRNFEFAQQVLKTLQQATLQADTRQLDMLKQNDAPVQQVLPKLKHKRGHEPAPFQAAPLHRALLHPSQEQMPKKDYKKTLKKLEKRLAHALRYEPRQIILLFEGMDAAGKGGSIKRIIRYLDPREYHIHSISAPELHERQRAYLWRFWNKLSVDGSINIFDRSWYGRVLVERVENFISAEEWQRSYGEINNFEKCLSQYNTVVIKFWLSISKDEQLKRFEHRQNTPQKYFKITEDDWRNREHWDEYIQAASDMLQQTSTEYAPWHVVATDDKYTARIQVLSTILERLEQNSSQLGT